jgi:inorganic pyrophosphatase
VYEDVHDLDDVPPRLLDEIEHFFDVYKMLEPGKNATTRGYEGRDAAYAEIGAATERFQRSA